MYCYITLCLEVVVNNAARVPSPRCRSRSIATLPLAFHRHATARVPSPRYRSRSIPFHSIPFHSISNVCIYILYSPASNAYLYSSIHYSSEITSLQAFVRGYETFALFSIKSEYRVVDVFGQGRHK